MMRSGRAVVALVVVLGWSAWAAQAAPVAGDVNSTGQVDAVDVQLVINGALGLAVVGLGDIDYGGTIDAVDVQLVINAALALDIDADDDGLSDAAELRLGTLVNGPDSDGDGIPDGQEMLDGTNPLPPPMGSVVGWVQDTDGKNLADVEVRSNAGGVTWTNAVGFYELRGVLSGAVVISFFAAEYTSDSRAVEVLPDTATTVNSVLKRLNAPVTLDATQGGELSDASGNRIQFTPASIVNAQKKSVTGPIEVRITALDVTNESDLAAFPGEFIGISPAKNGELVQLESFALADFRVTQNGEPLNLADGATAQIELALPVDTPLESGQSVPLWYFDDSLGLWVESGSGIVGAASDGSGLAYFAEVPHLSWWNCDLKIEPSQKHCLAGYVRFADGSPGANTEVVAVGVSYNGATNTFTDRTGHYCVDVIRGSTVRLEVWLPESTTPVIVTTVQVPTTVAECSNGNCTVIENLIIDFGACLEGHVKDYLGNPLANVEIYTSIGNRVFTDQDGNFCVTVPGNIDVTVYSAVAPAVVVHTRPEGSCVAGDCAQAIIEASVAQDGDLVGIVRVSSSGWHGDDYPGDGYVGATAIFALGKGDLVTSLYQIEVGTADDFDFAPTYRLEPDTCIVLHNLREWYEWYYDIPLDVADTAGPMELVWAVYDEALSLVSLDPGKSGTLAAAQESNTLYPLGEIFPELREHPDPFVRLKSRCVYQERPLYYLVSRTPPTSAKLSWPGGADIGPFEFSVNLPRGLKLNSPNGPAVLNEVLDTTQPLTVTWETVASSNAMVRIELVIRWWIYTPFEFPLQREGFGFLACNAQDDGSFTIPREVMLQLPGVPPTPERGGVSYYQELSVQRMTSSVVEVPLARSGGSGFVRTIGTHYHFARFWYRYHDDVWDADSSRSGTSTAAPESHLILDTEEDEKDSKPGTGLGR
ncbi:MAG: hypothetical protein HY706_12825 [Candidatus Hydrogenedentes bacterium]|nr:hypothetical protein [Candidatus Hydrogenedentota bacterium]